MAFLDDQQDQQPPYDDMVFNRKLKKFIANMKSDLAASQGQYTAPETGFANTDALVQLWAKAEDAKQKMRPNISGPQGLGQSKSGSPVETYAPPDSALRKYDYMQTSLSQNEPDDYKDYWQRHPELRGEQKPVPVPGTPEPLPPLEPPTPERQPTPLDELKPPVPPTGTPMPRPS